MDIPFQSEARNDFCRSQSLLALSVNDQRTTKMPRREGGGRRSLNNTLLQRGVRATESLNRFSDFLRAQKPLKRFRSLGTTGTPLKRDVNERRSDARFLPSSTTQKLLRRFRSFGTTGTPLKRGVNERRSDVRFSPSSTRGLG